MAVPTGLFPLAAGASAESLQTELDELLARTLSSSGAAVHSVILHLEAPDRGFNYSGAFGQLQAGSDEAIAITDRFYLASISKTMTAVRILQLVEEGRFSLDSTLQSLAVLEPAAMNALHRLNDKSYGPDLTIRQLLNHRSGLKDYLLDDRTGISSDFEAGLAPGSMAAIWMSQWQEFLDCQRSVSGCPAAILSALYPGRPWTPWSAADFQANPADRDAGLLNFYLSEMADSALFIPGTDSHYSDTNFLLLGIIIEQVTDSSLDEQLAQGIFRPMAMRDSYLGSQRVGIDTHHSRLSDFWIGETAFPSSGIDISWDWGGGGVVSTAQDLSIFLQGLINGKLFRNAETLQHMLEFLPVRSVGGVMQAGYGLGIRYALTENGPKWGHSGAWGARMEHFPELGLYITGTVNAYGTGADEVMLNEAVRLLTRHFQTGNQKATEQIKVP